MAHRINGSLEKLGLMYRLNLPAEQLADPRPTQEDDAIQMQRKIHLLLIGVRPMPRHLRQVFRWRMKGYRYREIAEKLGISVGAVGRRLSEAREFLTRLKESL